MVFSSVPLYLDPYNWQQQSHQQQQLGGGQGSSSQNPQLPQSASASQSQVGATAGTIRPGSMVDRARLAKLPMPETGLKCPRCESTNTKFCYFNNYSLSQPRHFCKTCRRYWTRGGALRNVPVGGGNRRNKRSSKNSTSSKSPAINNDVLIPTGHQDDDNSSGPAPPISSSSNNNNNSTGIGFPLLASLQGLNNTHQSNLGLNFGGIIQPQIGTHGSSSGNNNNQSILGFHVGSNNTSNYPNFLAGFEPPSSGLYPFHTDHQNVEAPPLPLSSSIFGDTQHIRIRCVPSTSEDQNQNAPDVVKAEEALSQAQGFNLVSSSRPFMGVSENNHHQFWDGNNNAWPDFSGINNSSSTTQNML